MPKALLDKFASEYPGEPDAKYKIANAKGFMHGSKETAKGAAAESKFVADHPSKATRAAGQRKALMGDL